MIYIALRFDLKFAVPVIVAMLHDIVITVGVYSIAFKEVSVATVAAVLTVLGYSIYDTIIIFDRVRENIPLMRRQSFATIMNVSLWETIRRSLATTFITLLPVIALEVLGGATLKDFAFALIVGVISGAYSSIFIAAPLLTIWKEREPEYAKRKRFAGRRRRHARRRAAAPQVDAAPPRSQASEQALAAEPTPELVDVVAGVAVRAGRAGAPREAPPAPPHEAAWPRAVATGSSTSSRSCSSSCRRALRGSRAKLSEQALGAVRALVDELNLVTRDDLDELELRVAQLEHRLRLLEQRATHRRRLRRSASEHRRRLRRNRSTS